MALVRGGSVRPHVQAFADAVADATGVKSFGTYVGHDPSIDRALDIFVPLADRVLGEAICEYALAHLERFGIDYVIYRQRIYNPEVAPYWRQMADRGSPTQNHMDHVHVSFEPTAPKPGPVPDPVPTPDPEPLLEDDGMKFIAVSEGRGKLLAGENVAEDGRIRARYVGEGSDITAMVESGAVANYDRRPEMPAAVFDRYYRVVG